ncbi:hypothetical protein L596_016259 [Steinernema carpocapsae]|uniref:Uncharacterized protein n=1 Tax=Steinernema carpocapsae TaxID=34508 RepID=A0A4U5NIF8_STECR|nr:hypothetical protein L596_016259 [Steinernema carpocapsae]
MTSFAGADYVIITSDFQGPEPGKVKSQMWKPEMGTFRQPTQTVRVSSLFENMIKSYLASFLGSFLLGSFLT